MKTFLTFILLTLSCSTLNANDLTHWLAPKDIPYPKNNPITPEKVELGKLLFFDKRLSKSDTISCATCHDPKLGWSDGLAKSKGDQGRVGRRNAPTILNSAYLANFFHDGRATTLEEQAFGPIETRVEMNMPLEELVKKLANIKGYQKLFAKAFPYERINKWTIVKAIASFERTIIAKEAPFDRWVKGDKSAISKYAQEGFDIFENKGECDKCHNGFNFTNESFNNIGLGDEKDLGVYEISKSKSKIWYGAFKTPTLRDIEHSAPYFHDGSVQTLEEAVFICGNGGRKPVKIRSPFFRDRQLDTDDVNKVVAFLKTLTSPPLDIEIPTKFPQ